MLPLGSGWRGWSRTPKSSPPPGWSMRTHFPPEFEEALAVLTARSHTLELGNPAFERKAPVSLTTCAYGEVGITTRLSSPCGGVRPTCTTASAPIVFRTRTRA